MRAIVYERYGPPEVLEIREIERPVPAANEVLIKTRATTVTAGDRRVRSLDVPAGFRLVSRLIFGLARPKQKILGTELAGVIEAVGHAVTRFSAGDPVFVYDSAGMGCYAQYKCMPENGMLAPKPPNIGFEEAAALSFGGATALDFFRRGGLAADERVLVNGASGSVGSAAVQLARHFGAEVTAVCSTANVDWVRALGARHVIDYTQQDFTQGRATYDVIVDTAGTAPFSRCRRVLSERGRLLIVLGGLGDMLGAPFVSLASKRRVVAGPAAGHVEDLHLLARLAEAGEFRPVIDRRYAYEQIVEAHRYVDAGHKRGNVVVTWPD